MQEIFNDKLLIKSISYSEQSVFDYTNDRKVQIELYGYQSEITLKINDSYTIFKKFFNDSFSLKNKLYVPRIGLSLSCNEEHLL